MMLVAVSRGCQKMLAWESLGVGRSNDVVVGVTGGQYRSIDVGLGVGGGLGSNGVGTGVTGGSAPRIMLTIDRAY